MRKGRLSDYREGRFSLRANDWDIYVVGLIVFYVWMAGNVKTDLSQITKGAIGELGLDEKMEKELNRNI